MLVTTDPADANDHTSPTPPANVTAESNGGHIPVRWEASTCVILAPQAFIRYDVYVNGELRAVVVGKTTADVEGDFGVNNISVVAVDTADNESAPGTTTVSLWIHVIRATCYVRTCLATRATCCGLGGFEKRTETRARRRVAADGAAPRPPRRHLTRDKCSWCRGRVGLSATGPDTAATSRTEPGRAACLSRD